MTRTPLARLVQVELRKTSDTRSGRWLLAVLALLAVGGVVVVLTTSPRSQQSLSDFLYLVQLPIALLLPVLGVLSMTSEWSQRTALSTFALVPNRGRVLGAKLLALLVLAELLVAASLVASVLATLVAGGGWGPAHDLPALLGRVVLFQALVVVTGAAFGLALLNAPAALVGFLLLPTLVSGLASAVHVLRAPARWVDWATSTTRLLGDDLTGRAWAQLGVSLLVWAVLPLAVGGLRVQRRDVQ